MNQILLLHFDDLARIAAENEARRQAQANTVAAILAENERERAEAAAQDERWRIEAQRKQLLFLRRYYPDKYLEEIARLQAETPPPVEQVNSSPQGQ